MLQQRKTDGTHNRPLCYQGIFYNGCKHDSENGAIIPYQLVSVDLGFKFSVRFDDRYSKEWNGIVALNFHSEGNIFMKIVEYMEKIIGCFFISHHNEGVINITSLKWWDLVCLF